MSFWQVSISQNKVRTGFSVSYPHKFNALERVAVHTVPIGIGGHAEGAVALLTTAAATEKRTGVAGDLVAGDGNVLEDAFLHRVVVGIEGGHGEFRQYVVLSVRQGVDVEDCEAGGNSAVFSLLRIDAAVACRRAESRKAARVVELQAGDVRRDFFIVKHEPEHSDGTGQHKVIRLLAVGYFVAGERHFFLRSDGG